MDTLFVRHKYLEIARKYQPSVVGEVAKCYIQYNLRKIFSFTESLLFIGIAVLVLGIIVGTSAIITGWTIKKR